MKPIFLAFLFLSASAYANNIDSLKSLPAHSAPVGRLKKIIERVVSNDFEDASKACQIAFRKLESDTPIKSEIQILKSARDNVLNQLDKNVDKLSSYAKNHSHYDSRDEIKDMQELILKAIKMLEVLNNLQDDLGAHARQG